MKLSHKPATSPLTISNKHHMPKKRKKTASKVWVPPESTYLLPPRPFLQTLPLLPWDYFQRLCARLAQKSGDVEFSQEYGLPGQDQEGIDVYVRHRATGRYSVWQCKKYQAFSATLVRDAVDEFLKGDWVPKTEEFVLCITAPTEERNIADEIEKQRERLHTLNIVLTPIGITQLSDRLKGQPELVHDFFGMQAVKDFCGEDAATKLSRRKLSPEDVLKLRSLLHRCYMHHFDSVDPDLPSLTSAMTRGPQPLPLAERYIVPDILESRQISQTQAVPVSAAPSGSVALQASAQQPAKSQEPGRMVTVTTEFRRTAIEWLIEGDLSVIIGDPGIGKSSLLRYILLDLLSKEPRHEDLAIKWGNRLPVWIPFAMWTRMVGESESSCSLADMLKTWLSKVSASSDLHTLVQQALEDSRLLLFVDGLDEWSNEVAARSSVTLLEQFVGEHEIPAIATSRPLGFERLGGLSGRWRRAKLAGLTADQQRKFSSIWFLHRERALKGVATAAEEVDFQKTADTEANVFIEELQRENRLARLGEIPLLLSGLIALSSQSVRLPRSRFKAYEELTRLLLQEQPQRREKAAHARTPASNIGQKNRDRALARLAFAIHQAPGSDSIDRTSAEEILCDFFTKELKKLPGEALQLAEELLAVSADTIGILVEKSPQEIGFPHRAFQEFLAARHLNNLSFDDQKGEFKRLFGSPQWHDALLCLCHLDSRTDEVDSLIDLAEGVIFPIEFEPARKLFLAELVFDDLNCSAKYAEKIANHTFREIETGTWPPLREQLLDRALDGLFSDSLKQDVQTKIQKWFPDRFAYRSSVYEAMVSWPREPEIIEALWRGLLDEVEWNQRSAAETLAQLFAGDIQIGARLLALIHTPDEPRRAAYALHSLCIGWPSEPQIPGLLQMARSSAEPLLQIVAVCQRVKRREIDKEDRNLLLDFARKNPSYHWINDVGRALLEGWPRDLELKRIAIESVLENRRWEAAMSPEVAGQILMEGFPQDNEVANIIAQIFRQEEYPQHSFGFHGSDWQSLVKHFGGHPLLRDAVDDWIEKKPERAWDCQICLLSKSDRAKAFLCKPSEKTGLIGEMQARWLVRGWGMNDPEAAKALSDLAATDAAKSVAHLLPAIMSDKKACRQRLLGYLREESEYNARLAIIGLIELGATGKDQDVAEAALGRYAGKLPCGISYIGVWDLISHFSHYPPVKELAIHQVKNRGGDIGVVARAYAQDADMRQLILSQINPLPDNLRLRLVDRMSRLAPEDYFAHTLLKDFDEDTGVTIKTVAAIGYAHSVRERGDSDLDLIAQLEKNLYAVGPDNNERRQAAFAGLLELDRMDIVKVVSESKNDPLELMGLGSAIKENLRFASHLTKNWGRVQNTFGSTLLDRVRWTPDEFLEQMISATSDENLIEALLARLAKNKGGENLSVRAIQIRSKQWQGTERLRHLCLDLVIRFAPRDWNNAAPGVLAAEILSEQFAHDSTTRLELEKAINTRNNSAITVALCGGWPDSPALIKIRDDQSQHLMTPAQVYLFSCDMAPSHFVNLLGKVLENLTGSIWDFLPTCTRALESRFKLDPIARENAFCRLEANATAEEKVNIPQFLRRTDNRQDRLHTWARAELANQHDGKKLPESALDIYTGRIRPVAHILMDLLSD